MDPVKASSVGMTGVEVDGVACLPDDEIFPCPGSLCMGFSWSLFFAERSSENLMKECSSLEGSSLVTDRGDGMVFSTSEQHTVKHTVYVDNLRVVSPDRPLVGKALDEMEGFR